MEKKEIIQEKKYSFDKLKVKSIISDFYKEFTEKGEIIEKAIEEDFKVERIKLDYALMKKQIEEIMKIDIDIFNKNISGKIYTGIGKIGVMYDGCSYITLDLILKGLLTHNDIYLFSSDYMLATNTVLITLINDLIKKHKYEAVMKHLKARSELYREAYQNQNEFDELIFIGAKENFAKIKNDFKIPVIFKEYGNIYIYAEAEEEFKKILSSIDRFAYDNNFNIEYLTGNNIDEIILKMNDLGENDIIGVFSKNSKIAYEVITKVKTKNIFINKNPFDNYMFKFDEQFLIREKNLIY